MTSADRNPELQSFVDALQAAFAAAKQQRKVADVVERLFSYLARPGSAGVPNPIRLPVCDCLPTAFDLASRASAPVARLAAALERLAPDLAWAVRSSGGPFASANWPEGHANATVIGPLQGLETRGDAAIGVSLLAPHVRYPDHRHAPEEIYLLLTPGRFQHGESAWFEPGAGGTLHNEPNIRHAMASQDTPLLAVWCHMLT